MLLAGLCCGYTSRYLIYGFRRLYFSYTISNLHMIFSTCGIVVSLKILEKLDTAVAQNTRKSLEVNKVLRHSEP
jgi:hypothetical protein